MLIISRRENEKFLFPNLGITVQLMKVAGKVAKIGIQAPDEIRVLREELVDDKTAMKLPASLTELAGSLPRKFKHDFRNRLSPISLGLQLAQKQIETGRTQNLDQVIRQLIGELKSLDRDLLGDAPQTDASEQIARVISEAETDDAKVALVVDDNANERSLLSSLLELSGYAVVVVEDGQAALEYLNQSFSLPDFVLLDMNMPRMNGASTIAEIRADEKFKGLKVFAVSGCEQEEIGVSVGPEGVDRWFTKPLDARLLMAEMCSIQVA